MPFLNVILALIIVGILTWLVNDHVASAGPFRTVLNVTLGLMIVGMVLWLINTYVPMAGSIKAILNIVVVVATCVRVLQVLGLWGDAVRMWSNLRINRAPRV